MLYTEKLNVDYDANTGPVPSLNWTQFLYFKYRKSITIWDAWQPYFTVTGY
jgi:hypothetical protein